MEGKLDYKQALELYVSNFSMFGSKDSVDVLINIRSVMPYAEIVFGTAKRILSEQIRTSRRNSSDPSNAHNGVPDYETSKHIQIPPIETFEARVRKYFDTWGPRLMEIFWQEYDGGVALVKVADEVRERIEGENREAESQLKKETKIVKIKIKLEETAEGLETFYRVMRKALSHLPGAQGARFEVLTPEMAYERNFPNGFYALPPEDTIYIVASNYHTGKVRPVEAWLKDLAHEAAHRPNPNGHDVSFVLREQRNLEILRRLSIDELLD